MRSGRVAVVVVRTLGLMIVRGMLGLFGCGSAPDADMVEIAVPRHQLAVLHRQVPPAAVHAGRSHAAGDSGEALTPAAVGRLLGDAVDIAALASGTRRPPMDLSLSTDAEN